MSNNEINNICCIGAGYVGGPTMAVIAKHCPEIQINVVDTNKERISAWNHEELSNLPIYEPGLTQIIKAIRGKNLHFSCEIEKNISEADMIFISVNTPTKTKGIGAGEASDLKWVEICARQVSLYAKGHTIVIEKSTLPVRTAEVIKNILDNSVSQTKNDEGIGKTFDVLSNPEFLSEGTAIRDLESPDRVLIGGDNKKAINILSKIYLSWVPKQKILQTNIWSSELAKLTANAFLAQRISAINSIGALCEATGADVREVSRAIGTDTRIGTKFLDSSPGFGGSCFKKDILNLVYLAKYFGLPQVADFWQGVVELNNWHQKRISELIVKKLFGTLSGKKIIILGFAFKANTNDTRESAAIQICKDLMEEGAILHIHDPKVNSSQISIDLNVNQIYENDQRINSENNNFWIEVKDIYHSFIDADAIVLLTNWEDYSSINWKLASKKMRRPGWIFDARSIVNQEDLANVDLNFWRVGDGALN